MTFSPPGEPPGDSTSMPPPAEEALLELEVQQPPQQPVTGLIEPEPAEDAQQPHLHVSDDEVPLGVQQVNVVHAADLRALDVHHLVVEDVATDPEIGRRRGFARLDEDDLPLGELLHARPRHHPAIPVRFHVEAHGLGVGGDPADADVVETGERLRPPRPGERGSRGAATGT